MRVYGTKSFKQIVTSAFFALAFAATGIVVTAPDTFAATQTWTGADCVTDCNFSNSLNWQSGVVPVNGDTVIVNYSAIAPLNDIANLSLASLTLNNNDITLNANLVLTGSLTAASSGTNTITATASGNLVLGGNVTMSGTKPLTLTRNVSGSLQLGGHTLTLANFDYLAEFDGGLPMTGTGTVVYDSNFVTISAANTYSGTTNITANGSPVVGIASTNPFGSSIVNIADGGRMMLDGTHSSLTIANVINIAAQAQGNAALLFGYNGTSGSYALSGIVLNSEGAFSHFNPAGPTVNLTGTTSNGYCVDYYGNEGLFTGGPVQCEILAVTVGAGEEPGVPNTALRMINAANPLLVAALGIVSAAVIALFARKQFSARK